MSERDKPTKRETSITLVLNTESHTIKTAFFPTTAASPISEWEATVVLEDGRVLTFDGYNVGVGGVIGDPDARTRLERLVPGHYPAMRGRIVCKTYPHSEEFVGGQVSEFPKSR